MKALCNSANQKRSDFLFVTGAWPGARPPHAPPGLGGSSERTAGRCEQPCLQVSGIRIRGGGSRVSHFSVKGRRLVAGRPGHLRAGSGFYGRAGLQAGPGAPHTLEHGPLPRHAVVFLLFCRSPRMETDHRAVPTVCHCQ